MQEMILDDSSQKKILDDSSRLDFVEIARVADMLPSFILLSRAKDISAPRYIGSYRVRGSDVSYVRGYKQERWDGARGAAAQGDKVQGDEI